MKRQLVQTKDNSSTLFVPELDEHYHSIHGALRESLHIFIEAGFRELANSSDSLTILETGFGTGLNALLTLLESEKSNIPVRYYSLEKYPVTKDEWEQLNYASEIDDPETGTLLNKLHELPWGEWVEVNHHFQLYKDQKDFRKFESENEFDLIYFDAFAPSAQPDLWTIAMFQSMYKALKDTGLLVTYCVKGEVRRNMKAAGFEVEKIPGPPGKREMARAWKRKNHDT